MHPQIEKLLEGLVARKKYIYLAPTAVLKEKLHLFTPASIELFRTRDGQKEHHDFRVPRRPGYEIALDASTPRRPLASRVLRTRLCSMALIQQRATSSTR